MEHNGAEYAIPAGQAPEDPPRVSEHRRLHALQRLKFIRLKTLNGERTAQQIVSQEGCTLEHAGQRLRESLDAFRVQTIRGKQGVIYRECAPDFDERRRAAELVLRLHECHRGPNARVEEPDMFAANTKVDPLIEEFRKLDIVDRNLILRASELFIDMIEDRKQHICEERYGSDLDELTAQLHNEAAKQVDEELRLSRNQSPVSEGPLEEASVEGRDSSREVSNGF